MSVAASTAFRTDTGILVADRGVLEALVRLAGERTPLPAEAIEPLSAAGAFAEGRLHPLLQLAHRRHGGRGAGARRDRRGAARALARDGPLARADRRGWRARRRRALGRGPRHRCRPVARHPSGGRGRGAAHDAEPVFILLAALLPDDDELAA